LKNKRDFYLESAQKPVMNTQCRIHKRSETEKQVEDYRRQCMRAKLDKPA